MILSYSVRCECSPNSGIIPYLLGAIQLHVPLASRDPIPGSDRHPGRTEPDDLSAGEDGPAFDLVGVDAHPGLDREGKDDEPQHQVAERDHQQGFIPTMPI